MNRWQYPGHVEPVLPTARTVTEPLPDKWGPLMDRPQYARTLSAAILAGPSFYDPFPIPTIITDRIRDLIGGFGLIPFLRAILGAISWKWFYQSQS